MPRCKRSELQKRTLFSREPRYTCTYTPEFILYRERQAHENTFLSVLLFNLCPMDGGTGWEAGGGGEDELSYWVHGPGDS